MRLYLKCKEKHISCLRNLDLDLDLDLDIILG